MQVQQMMSDPKFKAEMEKYTSDPRFQQSVEQANEMLGESAAADMLKDPKVYEQYLKMFSTGKENMMRGVQHMQAAMADPKEMAAAMEMLKDPDTMAEVERMMADPEFQREMQQYTMGADFQNAMSRAKKQVDDMMKDPNKLANLQAQMEAMLKQ
uniref:STI1 domain-containing protein n=1 Tax=Phaeomonas parva TaxID=124430 RepID=A0A7S1XNM6_9STRA|mmetsp:Transcript_19645/g.59497  ORF Transcript_19645/g.59497 Transcript_19645/m.59497 type:complete len:155 (+) Transcript_19645:662-1126(+)